MPTEPASPSQESASVSAHALAPGTRLRDYTIVSVIGTGGFSIVYKALDNALEREVAIKEYFPGALALRDAEGHLHPYSRDAASFSKGIDGFLNEGKLLAAFDHPALVRVYRCWEERGTAYLAMRLYHGITLREAVLSGQWHTDLLTLPALLAPMCDALDLLHAANCFHRDVAPDNIMLVDGGAPVLLDFGAARKAIEHTQVFTAILKPGYAPIEQYGDGELKQGPWTDIYALAGVLHFTLSGTPPPTAINRMIRDGMPRPRDAFAGRLPEHWLDAIEAALAVKPEARPASISEFRALFSSDELAAVEPEPAPEVISSAPLAELKIDADSTVVMPRKPVAATLPLPAPVTVTTAPIAKPLPASPKARQASRLIGILALLAALLVAFVLWQRWQRVAAPPAVAPTAPVVPVVPANDTFDAKKTSLPVGTPDAEKSVAPALAPLAPLAPAPVLAPIEVPPAIKPAAPKTLVDKPKSVTQPEAKTVTNAKPPASYSEANDDAATPAPSRKRPERCDTLMERFSLGELLSNDDQRFIRERCK